MPEIVSPQHDLLLGAALFPGGKAVQAWREWQASVREHGLEPGSHNLFPMVLRNLRDRVEDDPVLDSLQPYRHSVWLRNRQLSHDLLPAVSRLCEAGFRTLLLKGAALTAPYYRDPTLRPQSDLDVLVPAAEFAAACRYLPDHGWMPKGHGLAVIDPRFKSEIQFAGPAGMILDLHSRPLDDAAPDLRLEDLFWEASVAVSVEGIETRAFCASDNLLHVCLHGQKRDPIPHLQWVTDALMILDRGGDDIDWERMVELANGMTLGWQLEPALGYLQRRFEAPVPDGVFEGLETETISDFVRVSQRVRAQGSGRPWDRIRFHYATFNIGLAGSGPVERLQAVPDYLRHVCQSPRLWRFPLVLIIKYLRLLKRRLPSWRKMSPRRRR